MPKPKPKTDAAPEGETAPADVAPPRLRSMSEFMPKARRAIDDEQAHLATLRADYATTVAEIVRLEQSRKEVPAEIYKNRAVLESKIEESERDIIAVATAQAEANYAADRHAWADLQRQRALCVVAIRKINRAIEDKKRSYRVVGIEPRLHADGHTLRLFGHTGAPGVSGLGAEEYLRQCVNEGYLTTKETSDA